MSFGENSVLLRLKKEKETKALQTTNFDKYEIHSVFFSSLILDSKEPVASSSFK